MQLQDHMQKVINKLLKDINEEKLKNNHKRCIELYNSVGGSYSEIGEYAAAIEYHEKALDTAKTIGDRLETALALRFIGEARAALSQFFKAISDIKRYLELVQRINDKVEIQRAWTTLGRVYLMQAQDMKDNSVVIDDKIKSAALKAEKHFQTALDLAKSVQDQVDEKEYAQMTSGLFVNIGLVKDICGDHKGCEFKFLRAIEICKTAKIKEDLFRCQIVLASIYRQKNNIQLAAKTSEDALNTAKSIGQKLLICDAYIERGLVKLWLRDFKDAKRNFVQAYFEKSPNEEDHLKAIRLAKLAHLICTKYQQLSQDSVPSEMRMKLCDKLGDLFVAVNCYKLAVEFYKRAFTDAKICSKPKSELARILFSVAETYADDGQFEHAKVCYEKEVNYRNGNDEEQCQSYIKIAHMHEYLNHEPDMTCKAYEAALEKAGRNDKLVYNVLKDYVAYMEKRSYNQSRTGDLKKRLVQLEESCPEIVKELETEGVESDELEDEAGNIDDIISDDEDNEELLTIGRRKTRGAKKFKRNEVGDTPLHKACIDGQFEKVKSLISQGHEVNPRDNAGWIPLHEACNIGRYDIVEYLIEHGGDVNNRGLGGMSPLHDAAINGHYDVMRLLIKHGANVISLTDQGETVLSCLRDFKKRQGLISRMTDREMTEYKQMEAELLNIMDRRGFNLMEENMKNLSTRSASGRTSELSKAGSNISVGSNAGTSGNASEKQRPQQNQRTKRTMPPPPAPIGPPNTRPRPRANLNALDYNRAPLSDPVKNYKDVIGGLKRKKMSEDEKEVTSCVGELPATYSTNSNPSEQTKDWLIDDVSRNRHILNRRSNHLHNVLYSDEEEEEDSQQVDIEEDEVITFNPDDQGESFGDDYEDDVEMLGAVPPRPRNRSAPIRIESESPSPVLSIFTQPDENQTSMSLPFSDNANESASNSMDRMLNWGNISAKAPEINRDPLIVQIGDKKLVIPFPGDRTIKDLKESIIERYCLLTNVRPNITLSYASDPDCILSDIDMCRDVIRNENLVAKINSWQLETIDRSYVDWCVKLNIESDIDIKIKLRVVERMRPKLDLSFHRFAKNHVKPLVAALAYRDFTDVNLTGATCLFEYSIGDGRDLLNSMATWTKMTHLTLKCVGLAKVHFETICNKMKFDELKSIDLTYNIIVYQKRQDFKNQIVSLRAACPKLRKLDMRSNNLAFEDMEGKNGDATDYEDPIEDFELIVTEQKLHKVTVR